MDFSMIGNRDEKHSVSAKELMGILPHRYPMFMLDMILDYDFSGGEHGLSRKNHLVWMPGIFGVISRRTRLCREV